MPEKLQESYKNAKVQSVPSERAVCRGEKSWRRGTWIYVEYIVGATISSALAEGRPWLTYFNW